MQPFTIQRVFYRPVVLALTMLISHVVLGQTYPTRPIRMVVPSSPGAGVTDIMASKKLMAIVRLQAAVLSYADVFFILTVLFLGFGVLGLLMKRPRGPAIEGK